MSTTILCIWQQKNPNYVLIIFRGEKTQVKHQIAAIKNNEAEEIY